MLTPSIWSIDAAFAFGLGAVIAAVVVPLTIAAQQRAALGQQIYEDGPRSHGVKQGTPTMGGLAFIAAVLTAAAAKSSLAEVPLAGLTLAAGCIGLVDDLLIVRKRRALGLRARTKSALLLVAALAYVAIVSRTQPAHATQAWFGHAVTMPQWLWFLLAVVAINATAHAVNITDGLDGLAAGSVAAPLAVLAYASHDALAIAVLGACLGFLWFNRHPARIFMGDTGSLALGALLAGCAIQANMLLVLPMLGLVFVIEALSVIAQVASFKTTGKRILKMSPLHHHFELSGWPEQRVTHAIVAASFMAAAITWIGLLLTNARGSAS
ncbi:MAG: phospho-N-acetylmuramoyl-pentapeptide-transferase [Candidatus Eremiobacteraeota bacterium]|nr:phospho-N-acetylmuramoyl-pentapeptide-transferase [Candidatus Eremiobacteraeota bacterium]